MKTQRSLQLILSICLLFAPSASADNKDYLEHSMKLTSPAFENNEMIPSTYTCQGADESPPLKWFQAPTNTKSFALIVDDPDAPHGTFVHWVLFNLPAAATNLDEHLTDFSHLNGAKQGTNDFGKTGYGGPCPPSGTHRYFFKLYALDDVLNLNEGATKEQALEAMKGHVVAESQLIGTYKKS